MAGKIVLRNDPVTEAFLLFCLTNDMLPEERIQHFQLLINSIGQVEFLFPEAYVKHYAAILKETLGLEKQFQAVGTDMSMVRKPPFQREQILVLDRNAKQITDEVADLLKEKGDTPLGQVIELITFYLPMHNFSEILELPPVENKAFLTNKRGCFFSALVKGGIYFLGDRDSINPKLDRSFLGEESYQIFQAQVPSEGGLQIHWLQLSNKEVPN